MRSLRARPLVLIVEDDPDVLLILRLNLEGAGCDTTLAADGDTALRRVDADKPDAVLLDLMLPIVDGWEVLAELTSRESAPPVVVCSARRGEHDVQRAMRLGAADFLSKPFDLDQLVASIIEVTGMHREHETQHAPASTAWTSGLVDGVGLDGVGTDS